MFPTPCKKIRRRIVAQRRLQSNTCNQNAPTGYNYNQDKNQHVRDSDGFLIPTWTLSKRNRKISGCERAIQSEYHSPCSYDDTNIIEDDSDSDIVMSCDSEGLYIDLN